MKNSKFIAIICLLATFIVALFLASCGVGGNAGDLEEPASPLDTESTGGTLVQEVGVDEGDIVKNFGDYVYKLQTDGVTVYKIKDGHIELKASGKFASSRNIPLEMYVTDQSIAVVYGKSSSVDGGGDYTGTPDYSEKPYTRVYVDVLINPTSLQQTEPYDLFSEVKYSFSLAGALVASRTYVDSKQAYFAFSYGGSFNYASFDEEYEDEDITSLQGNKYTTISYLENGETKQYEEAATVPGLRKFTKNYQPTVFMSLNLDDPSSSILNAVFGAQLFDIYMSETSIIPIFVSTEYKKMNSGGCYSYQYRRAERITYCFKLSPDLKIIDGVTLLDYNIYDRRAIKDYGDVIYIAATKNDGSGTTVIALDGKKFSLINRLDKIAPNEDVKSVTFGEEGEKRYCYITTFLQIDPLFKIDVTDPYHMQTLGFMEMPGFSTFMLTVGDKLITLGYADNGAQGRISTLKLAMYDASGIGLSTIDERTIEKVYYCEAIDDPRVIAVSGNSFAFSVTRSHGYRTDYTQELYVFELTADEIVLVGTVSNFANSIDGEIKHQIGYVEVSGEIKNTTDYGAYALQISRARFKEAYLYTFSDGVIASYRIITDESSPTGKLIADGYTERVFTSLSNTPLYK